jgi:hypothetical protein
VQLAIALRQEATQPDGWAVTAVIRLDPGEEMTRIAEDLAGLRS